MFPAIVLDNKVVAIVPDMDFMPVLAQFPGAVAALATTEVRVDWNYVNGQFTPPNPAANFQ